MSTLMNMLGNVFNRGPNAFTMHQPNYALTLAGLGLLGGSNPQQQFQGAAQGLMAGTQQDQVLRQQAQQAAQDAERKRALDAALSVAPKITPEMRGLFNAYPDAGVRYLADQAKPDASGADGYFGTPVYGQDAQGNPVLMQMGKNGTLIQPDLPSNITLTPGVQKVDLGTAWGILDRSGNVVSTIPKDVAGAASQTEVGKAQGEAQAGLTDAEATADEMLQSIELLKNHPGRETATGLSGTLDPRNYLPGTNAKNFEVARQQLLGQTFLQAYQKLRGGGQITEVEGAKAEAAIGRLSTAQGDAAFLKALNDLEDVVKAAKARARLKAGAPALPEAPPAAGDSGGWTVIDGWHIRESP